MANRFQQFTQPTTTPSNRFSQFSTAPTDQPEASRGVTGVAKDLGASFAGGANSLMELAGTLYGLTTGDMDNFARNQGAKGREYWNQRKTPQLLQMEQARKAKIDAADGEIAKVGTAFWETLKSPSLLASYTFEQLPNLLVSGGAGMAARAGAEVAAKAAGRKITEKVAERTALGGAVGAGGAMQGSDAGGQAYDQLMELPDDVWLANPDVQARINGNMDLLPQVKREMARELAADSAIASGIISVGINSLPVFRILESRLAGVKMKPGSNRLAEAGKGFAGETLGEGLEEGSGAFLANVATQRVDPSQSLTEGVGEATGMGMAAGPLGAAGGFSGRAGDTAGADVTRRIFDAPTVDDAIAQAGSALDGLEMPGVDFEPGDVPSARSAQETIPGMDIPAVEFDETGMPRFVGPMPETVGPQQQPGDLIPGVDFRTRRDDETDAAYEQRMAQEQARIEADTRAALEQKADQDIAAAEQDIAAQDAAERAGPSNTAMGNALIGAYLKQAPESAQEAPAGQPATKTLPDLDRVAVPTSVRRITMPSGNPFPSERVAKSSLSYRNNPGARIAPAEDGNGVVVEIPERSQQEWDQFAPETGTLGVPRAEMPQIKAEHRGAMVNFLKGKFIGSQKVEVDANTLKPTQAEFSRDKVQQALDYEGGDRSILISSDGYVVDGHHQWLANLDGKVQAIRIDAPIQEILDVIKQFPSATTGEGATGDRTNYSKTLIDFAKTAKSLKDVRDFAVEQFGPRALKNLEQAITGAWNIRNQAQRRRVNENDSLATAVAKLGGINLGWQQDITGDTVANKMVPGVGRVFSKNGTSPDDMALKLWEAGYLTQRELDEMDGRDALYEALSEELSGGRKKYQLNSLREQAEMEQAQEDVYQGQMEALAQQREENYQRIAQEHGQEAADLARLYDEAASETIDDDLSDIEIYEQKIQERENARETDNAERAGFAERRASAAERASGDVGIRKGGEEENGKPGQSERDQAQDSGEFGLETQTEADLQTRARDQKQAQAKEAEQRQQQEQRAAADDEAKDFRLTGSTSQSDTAAAYGQGDMLVQTRGQQQNTSQNTESQADEDSNVRTLNENGRASDGKPILPGDTFRTLSGRTTTAYPKQKSEKYASQWLIENATQEARSRGDSFNAGIFERTTLLKDGRPTDADRESMLMYLFGEQPDVVPKITKPMMSEGAEEASPPGFPKTLAISERLLAKSDPTIERIRLDGKDFIKESKAYTGKLFPSELAVIEKEAGIKSGTITLENSEFVYAGISIGGKNVGQGNNVRVWRVSIC